MTHRSKQGSSEAHTSPDRGRTRLRTPIVGWRRVLTLGSLVLVCVVSLLAWRPDETSRSAPLEQGTTATDSPHSIRLSGERSPDAAPRETVETGSRAAFEAPANESTFRVITRLDGRPCRSKLALWDVDRSLFESGICFSHTSSGDGLHELPPDHAGETVFVCSPDSYLERIPIDSLSTATPTIVDLTRSPVARIALRNVPAGLRSSHEILAGIGYENRARFEGFGLGATQFHFERVVEGDLVEFPLQLPETATIGVKVRARGTKRVREVARVEVSPTELWKEVDLAHLADFVDPGDLDLRVHFDSPRPCGELTLQLRLGSKTLWSGTCERASDERTVTLTAQGLQRGRYSIWLRSAPPGSRLPLGEVEITGPRQIFETTVATNATVLARVESEDEIQGRVTILVRDLGGRVLAARGDDCSDPSMELETAPLPAGRYSIQARLDGGTMASVRTPLVVPSSGQARALLKLVPAGRVYAEDELRDPLRGGNGVLTDHQTGHSFAFRGGPTALPLGRYRLDWTGHYVEFEVRSGKDTEIAGSMARATDR